MKMNKPPFTLHNQNKLDLKVGLGQRAQGRVPQIVAGTGLLFPQRGGLHVNGKRPCASAPLHLSTPLCSVLW